MPFVQRLNHPDDAFVPLHRNAEQRFGRVILLGVDIGEEPLVGLGIGNTLRSSARQHLTDDARVVGQSQRAVGNAECGAADQFAPLPVVDEDAGAVAVENLADRLGQLGQHRGLIGPRPNSRALQ